MKTLLQDLCSTGNKTGLQPVSRPAQQILGFYPKGIKCKKQDLFATGFKTCGTVPLSLAILRKAVSRKKVKVPPVNKPAEKNNSACKQETRGAIERCLCKLKMHFWQKKFGNF